MIKRQLEMDLIVEKVLMHILESAELCVIMLLLQDWLVDSAALKFSGF